METVKLRDEYIKLGQALKAAGVADTGVMAKEMILDGLVQVNKETEYRRGRKLYSGDEVTLSNFRSFITVQVSY